MTDDSGSTAGAETGLTTLPPIKASDLAAIASGHVSWTAVAVTEPPTLVTDLLCALQALPPETIIICTHSARQAGWVRAGNLLALVRVLTPAVQPVRIGAAPHAEDPDWLL